MEIMTAFFCYCALESAAGMWASSYMVIYKGINAETARICTSYGANSLVAGNYIYKSADIKSAIMSLKLLRG